jgi:hypothetical protein
MSDWALLAKMIREQSPESAAALAAELRFGAQHRKEMTMSRDIAWHKWATDDLSGFGIVAGVNIWTRGPSDDRDEWVWQANRWGGDYPGGCPRMVSGIGNIEGRASTEEEAVAMATAAAALIGMMPSDLSLDNPVPYRLVAVADGPDEMVGEES